MKGCSVLLEEFTRSIWFLITEYSTSEIARSAPANISSIVLDDAGGCGGDAGGDCGDGGSGGDGG